MATSRSWVLILLVAVADFLDGHVLRAAAVQDGPDGQRVVVGRPEKISPMVDLVVEVVRARSQFLPMYRS